jgi:hypothetical protein
MNIELWDNSKRAKTVITVFWVLILFLVIGIISGYYELELLKNAQLGVSVDESTASASDLRQMIIGLLQTGLTIVSIIVFLNWFRRAYGNLHRLGITYLKHDESMAVWSWFIPIIFLFRPVQIMKEIWAETKQGIQEYNSNDSLSSGGFIIGLWWALFITSNFIGKYVLQVAFKEDTIAQMIEGSQAVFIFDVLQISEALLVILIITRLSKMESKLAKEVQKNGGHIVFNK